jgi:hypothetical protein
MISLRDWAIGILQALMFFAIGEQRVANESENGMTSLLWATWNRCSWREKVWIVVLGALPSTLLGDGERSRTVILEGLFVVMAI